MKTQKNNNLYLSQWSTPSMYIMIVLIIEIIDWNRFANQLKDTSKNRYSV